VGESSETSAAPKAGFAGSVWRFLIPASSRGRILLVVACSVVFGAAFWIASRVPRGPAVESYGETVGFMKIGALVLFCLLGSAIVAFVLIDLVWRRRGSALLVLAALVVGAAIGTQYGPWWEVRAITGGRLTLQLETPGALANSGSLACTTKAQSSEIETLDADLRTIDGEPVKVHLWVSDLPTADPSLTPRFTGTKGDALIDFDVFAVQAGSTGYRGGLRFSPGLIADGLPGGTVTWDCGH